MPISSALFGESPYENYGKQKSIDTPLSLSASTTGSVARRTAWRSSDGNGPTPYSSKTKGSTLNWDDAQAQTLPTSDKGASFGGK
jgi:hypothetical protein